MRRLVIGALMLAIGSVAVGAVVSLTMSASAQDMHSRDSFGRKLGPMLGVVQGERSYEEFDMATGTALDGTPDAEKSIRHVREVVHVPTYYGKLVSVQSSGTQTVAWYESTDGDLRNVVLTGTTSRLYRVQRRAAAELDTEIR